MTVTRHELDHQHLTTTLARDLGGMMVGDYLGGGQFRSVYCYVPDDTCVVKLENGYGTFENALEHEVWREVKDTAFSRWFAPVVSISGAGCVLVQKRTTPIDVSKLPKKVPAFFTDLKSCNWGRYNGRIVCHDYGRNLLMQTGLTTRMRRADWD